MVKSSISGSLSLVIAAVAVATILKSALKKLDVSTGQPNAVYVFTTFDDVTVKSFEALAAPSVNVTSGYWFTVNGFCTTPLLVTTIAARLVGAVEKVKFGEE